MSGGAPAPLRGDLTQGPLLRTLLVFAMPQLVGNVLQSLNGSINAVWVGQLLGEEALAATANANIVMFLLFALVFGFGMAATVRIGQAWGRQDVFAARRALGAALGLTGLIALATTVLGMIFAPQLLDWLATPGASRAEALAYLRVVFIANPMATMMTTIAMGLRGAGDAGTPLRFLILSTVLDVVLNPLLIRGFGPVPPLGIAGSALATVIATSLALAALLAFIYARDLPLRLRGSELGWLKPQRGELRPILGMGLPMGAQMLVISGAGVIMIGLVNREGLIMAAAYGALLQVWNYIGMPAMAIGGAVSAMVAQHIGAAREERVDAIGLAGSLANLLTTGLLIAVLLPFDRPVLELFLGRGSEAVATALHIQTLGIWTYLPFGVTIVLFGSLRAYGVVWSQILVLLISMYLIRYGGYALLYPRFGADALWYSFIASSVMSLVLTLIAYFRGPWRRAMKARLAAEEGLG
ncbi:MATE family efflux transporter [Novosphingobium sp.]|uniref:MATE family efflux transporter n=1 Tax=Novosphingobium sp. TaxID=1874826 RepID=UPI001EB47CAA|nr:MATE family efflux transporter [Novosphingobium sp.]MBK6802489.1 MATE family efflux transporter [Novosphingobium sp.]MBK9009451.1 MATE family efflux transporter [Novosphingobium sp.]